MSKVLYHSGVKRGMFMAGSPKIYLASPKHLYVASPKNIYLSSPKLRDDFFIKLWLSQLNERIESGDSYAKKFLNDIDELAKKVELMKERIDAFKKDFYARVQQRKERIWGGKSQVVPMEQG